MSHREPTTDADLERLQHESFNYFLYEANAVNGLVIDKTEPGWPASIAATGLALAAYPVGVERGYLSRAAAVERTLQTLRFFWRSPQGPEPAPPGTGASTIIFSICGPAGAPGNASCQLWTARFCWPGR